MTAQFVQVGDLHLGPGARQADRLRALDQVIAEGAALPHLAAWLWPGDVFDRLSTVEDRNVLKDRVRRMAALAPVIGCYGNHDRDGDLDIFGDLQAAWPIHFSAVPELLDWPLAHGGGVASIFALPYPTEAGLVGAGVAPGLIPQTARTALEAIFLGFGAQLRDRAEAGTIPLMIGHINVAGSLKATGQPSIGAEIELDGGLLAHLPDCYVGLNHIHVAQAVGRAVYAGSLCRLNWGEIDPKRYVVVTYARPHKQSDEWDWHAEQRPVAVAPMYHVEGEFSRTGFSWHVADGPDGATIEGFGPQTDWTGTEVRARMRYKQSEGVVLSEAVAAVKAVFASAARFEFEPVCVPDRGLRAPEVAAARSLPEKLRAWATVTGVVLPAQAETRVTELETRDPDTLVAEAEARLSALTTIETAEPVLVTE